MGADQYHRWDEQAASALEWWHDAGVTTLVDDEPHDWLAPVKVAPARPATAPVEAPAPTGPDDYAAFWDWRLGTGAPERGWGTPILPPEGPRDADLAILVDQPNGDTLIGGAEGAMFDRILAAIGHSRDDTLIAALAMAHPLAGTLGDELLPDLAERAGRLMGLMPAKTVLIVGHTTSRALLGTNGAPVPRGLHGINQGERELQAIVIPHPRFMLKHPQVKRDAWRCLQMLLGGQA